jgi:hypothetical protein
LGLSASTDEFKNRLEKFNPDIVGVSISTLMVKEAIAILQVAKAFNKSIEKLNNSGFDMNKLDFDKIEEGSDLEKEIKGIYEVLHQALQTDTVGYSRTFVEAESKEEAMDLFNTFIADEKYIFECAGIDQIKPLKVYCNK